MAAVGGSVRLSHDDVGMHLRLSVRRQRDVAHQRQNLDLLIDGNGSVLPGLPLEVPRVTAWQAPMAVKWLPASPCSRAKAWRPAMTSSPVSKMTAKVRWPAAVANSLLFILEYPQLRLACRD